MHHEKELSQGVGQLFGDASAPELPDSLGHGTMDIACPDLDLVIVALSTATLAPTPAHAIVAKRKQNRL